jgi:hypothetical protein
MKCYLYWNETSKKYALVDDQCQSPDEGDWLGQFEAIRLADDERIESDQTSDGHLSLLRLSGHIWRVRFSKQVADMPSSDFQVVAALAVASLTKDFYANNPDVQASALWLPVMN